MEFDVTNILQNTNEQILNQCHNITTKPALIILFLTFIVSFLFFGLLLVKQSRGTLMKILVYTFLVSGIAFSVLYFMPITITQNIADLFNKLF